MNDWWQCDERTAMQSTTFPREESDREEDHRPMQTTLSIEEWRSSFLGSYEFIDEVAPAAVPDYALRFRLRNGQAGGHPVVPRRVRAANVHFRPWHELKEFNKRKRAWKVARIVAVPEATRFVAKVRAVTYDRMWHEPRDDEDDSDEESVLDDGDDEREPFLDDDDDEEEEFM